MSDMTDKLVELAESQIGGAYVFGAWGDACTPAHRKTRARISPKSAKAIYADCPVLAGKQSTCAGCVHEGKIEADCRGFTDWLLNAAGVIDLYGDTVTTQYNTARNWSGGGTVDALPNTPCILFRKDAANRYGHTGFYDGMGYAIHAKGHKYGIVREAIGKTGFTHWKFPREGESEAMEPIKQGCKGEEVKAVQTMLSRLGYACGGADGIFGAKTASAVAAYQTKKQLKADGICGTQTWSALQVDIALLDAEKPATTETLPTRAEFEALKADVLAQEARLRTLEERIG